MSVCVSVCECECVRVSVGVRVSLCALGMLSATGNPEDPRGARNALWEMPATLVLSRFIQQAGENADLELQGLLGGRPAFGRRLIRGEALRLGRVASEEQAECGGESGRDRCPCPALRAASREGALGRTREGQRQRRRAGGEGGR